MNSQLKAIIAIILFAIFLGAAVVAYNSLSDEVKPVTSMESGNDSTPTNKENPADDFTVFDAEGKEVKLSDHFGKPIVVNFWASWCPPCKAEMPYFDKVYQEVKDEVVFLMVDLVDGSQETQAKGQNHVDTNGFTFSVLFDNNQDAAITYRIRSIPSTMFIDKNGNIVKEIVGGIEEKNLRSYIDLIK